jgi:hypothetical protein
MFVRCTAMQIDVLGWHVFKRSDDVGLKPGSFNPLCFENTLAFHPPVNVPNNDARLSFSRSSAVVIAPPCCSFYFHPYASSSFNRD